MPIAPQVLVQTPRLADELAKFFIPHQVSNRHRTRRTLCLRMCHCRILMRVDGNSIGLMLLLVLMMRLSLLLLLWWRRWRWQNATAIPLAFAFALSVVEGWLDLQHQPISSRPPMPSMVSEGLEKMVLVFEPGKSRTCGLTRSRLYPTSARFKALGLEPSPKLAIGYFRRHIADKHTSLAQISCHAVEIMSKSSKRPKQQSSKRPKQLERNGLRIHFKSIYYMCYNFSWMKSPG